MTKYPDQYLHVRELRSGEEWIYPLRSNTKLDIDRIVKRWVKKQFENEFALDGNVSIGLEGDYYAKLITDARSPDISVVWQAGGFFIK